MATTTTTEETIEKFLNILSPEKDQLNGNVPPAILQKKNEAGEFFRENGFPTPRHEAWKYTNINPLIKKDYTLNKTPELTKETLKPLLIKDLNANTIVIENGIFRDELSTIKDQAQNLIIKPLTEAFKGPEKEKLEAHFGESTQFNNDAFNHLNTAFSNDGIYIEIPEGKALEYPVVFYYINNSTKGNTLAQPRNFFYLNRNAQGRFIETFATLGDNTGLTNMVNEFVLYKDAIADYYKIQHEGANAYHIGTTYVNQMEASNFHAYTFSFSGGLIRNNLNLSLNQEKCESHLYGLYQLNEKTHVDNHTTVDHKVPDCFSNELYKGVFDDHAKGVFNGKVLVQPHAQKTNAYQSNKNILLSKNASVDAKPQLEIFADDVSCSHGCTTGQLDKDAMFYLQSRGISQKNAKALLTYAFASEVIAKVQIQEVYDYLEELISKRLEFDLNK